MPFNFKPTVIPEVILVEPRIFKDDRGYFTEIIKSTDFQAGGITENFVQVNQSKSTKGVLRGLHYQLDPAAQGKAVRVIDGEIFDVALDMRVGSPTYGKWVGEILNSEKMNMLYIPAGFAHGFCVLSDTAIIEYYCTHVYSPVHDRGVIWNDKTANIAWPVDNPVLSDKDIKQPTLENAENNFKYVK